MASWEELALQGLAEDSPVEEPRPAARGPEDLPEPSGWCAAALSDAVPKEALRPSSASSELEVLPAVAPVGQPKAPARRGRRSALLLEALAEERPPAAPKAAVDRAEILRKARAAKAAKRAEVAAQVQSGNLVVALAPAPPDIAGAKAVAVFSPQTLRDIKLGTMAGAFSVSPLVPAMGPLSASGHKDEALAELIAEYARASTSTISSFLVKANSLGMRSEVLTSRLARVGCAAVLVDIGLHRELERAVVGANVRPIMYVDSHAYDETPMQMRVPEVEFDVINDPPPPEGEVGAMVRFQKTQVEKAILGEDNGPSKLFQCVSSVGLLAHVNPTDEEPKGKYVFITGSPLTWIQYLETSTAEVLKEALRNFSCTSQFAEQFGFKVRLAVSDSLKSNIKAERSMAAERGPTWSSLTLECEVHKVAGVQTKTLGLLEEEVSLMVNLSLSLRLAGNMKRFRACLRRVVASRLKILDGAATIEATAYRLECLRLFLARGSHSARRRALLWHWLNGDWREHSCIQHYKDPTRLQQHNTPEHICKMVTRALLMALAPRAPSLFPRHRWTGADISTDEVGLFCCVHGLLQPAYLAFLVSCDFAPARPWVQRVPLATVAGAACAPVLAIEDLQEDGDEDEAPGDDEARGEEPQSEQSAAAQAREDSALGQVDWARLNARARKLGFAFVMMPKVLSKVIVLRKAIEPFRSLMSSHLLLASRAWQLKQVAKLVEADDDNAQEGLEYRLVVAASQRLEMTFFETVRKMVFEAREWRILAAGDATVGLCSLCFRLLARAACGVQELLASEHDKFPFKLFLLLEDPSLAEVFEDAKDCELDGFSKGFIDHFKNQGLANPDAIACLRCLATIAKVDISHIEARHASLRRLLHASPQAKKPTAQTLSAVWTCARLAKRQAETFAKGVATKRPLKKPTATKQAAKKVKRRRAKRSAWQAYVHDVSKGVKADFKALYSQFEKLTNKELKVYQDKANEASHCRAKLVKKLRPFSSAQKARRAAEKVRQQQVWLRRRATQPARVQLDAMFDALRDSEGRTESALLANQEQLCRFDSAMGRHVAKQESGKVQRFAEKLGLPDVKAFSGCLRGAQGLAEHLVPTPACGMGHFHFSPDTATQVESVLAFASSLGNRTNLHDALQLEWDRRTSTIMQEGLPPLPNTAQADSKAARCRTAGICLCDEDGRRLANFSASFARLLKAQTKRRSPGRTALMQGLVVLKLSSADPSNLLIGTQIEAPEDLDVNIGQVVKWVHIGLMYLSPWRPTFTILQESAALPCVEGGVALKASGDFETFYKHMDTLDKDKAWFFCVYHLWESHQVLTTFVPAEVSVRKVGKPTLFWKGKGFHMPKRPRHPQPPPGPAEAEAQGSDGGEWGRFAMHDAEREARGSDDDDADDVIQDASGSEGEPAFCGLEDTLMEVMEELEEESAVGSPVEQTPSGLQPARASEAAASPVASEGFGRLPGSSAGPVAAPPVAVGLPAAQVAPRNELVAVGPPQVGRADVLRAPALSSVNFCGGVIAAYPDKSNPTRGRFQATCGNPLHGPRCRLTRAMHGSVRKQNSAQGRPLGLMAAWLLVAHLAEDAIDHDAMIPLLTQDQRAAAREDIKELPGGIELFSAERIRLEGEGEEPEGLP